ncbi:hypothetical protein, partial [Intestinibacillus massiliensis]
MNVRNVSGTVTEASSPAATMSCSAVSTWNSVSSTSEPHMPAGRPSTRRSAICSRFSSAEIGTSMVGMPPNESVSPSSTTAYSSTGRSFTLTPPLEPRS